MEQKDVFANVSKAPLDPILGTKIRYLADDNPNKVNLGIGAYRTAEGKPLVLRCVRQAEQALASDESLDKEYQPIGGHAQFAQLAQEVLLGKDTAAVKEKRVASVQSLSGTGSLRVAFEFLRTFFPDASMLISNPTWGNHKAIAKRAGLPFSEYRYWSAEKRGLDIDGMVADIDAAPEGSIVLLHACAHNPTGVDPTPDQWSRIADTVIAKRHIVLFDSAYQGFASGDLERDAAAIRLFADRGVQLLACQSFAKNFGLYGERVGALHIICSSPERAEAVKSQLNLVIRPMYSNPPVHGARIVHHVLSTPELYQSWREELLSMSKRIQEMRQSLLSELQALGTPGDWSHIVDQIGMFSFTGLNEAQSNAMIDKHHVYMLTNGRISMAGLNESNVKYVAGAIDDVVRNMS